MLGSAVPLRLEDTVVTLLVSSRVTNKWQTSYSGAFLSSFMREQLNALQRDVKTVRIGNKGAILDMLAP